MKSAGGAHRTSTSSIDGNKIRQRRAARRRQPRGPPGRRRLEPHGDARPRRVPLASAEGLRRSRRGARGWPSASPPCAAPATRRTKRSRIARRTKPASGPGPRVYGTGYLMEWQRVYYKMGIAISSVAQFEMELQRAKVLQHDLIKSYVRLPDLQQKRMVEFAHSIGVPVATHEIYPGGVCRRRQHRAHRPPPAAAATRRRWRRCSAATRTSIQLFGKSGRIFCPMISGGGARAAVRERAGAEERSALQAVSRRGSSAQVAAQPVTSNAGGGGDPAGGSGKMVLDVMRAGGADRRRHRHAERDQPARRADVLHHGRHVELRRAARRRPSTRRRRSASTPARSRPASSPISSSSTATRSRTSRTRTRCGASIANGRLVRDGSTAQSPGRVHDAVAQHCSTRRVAREQVRIVVLVALVVARRLRRPHAQQASIIGTADRRHQGRAARRQRHRDRSGGRPPDRRGHQRTRRVPAAQRAARQVHAPGRALRLLDRRRSRMSSCWSARTPPFR